MSTGDPVLDTLLLTGLVSVGFIVVARWLVRRANR
jgi:hypothetical protein